LNTLNELFKLFPFEKPFAYQMAITQLGPKFYFILDNFLHPSDKTKVKATHTKVFLEGKNSPKSPQYEGSNQLKSLYLNKGF
jgi:hypothetical protein